MKRLIVCKNCEIKHRKLFPVESPYPGEHVKFVVGTALSKFKCDICGSLIDIDEYACAISIWSDYRGIPYLSWEKEYIAIT